MKQKNEMIDYIWENLWRCLIYIGWFSILFYAFDMFGIREILLRGLNPNISPINFSIFLGLVLGLSSFMPLSPIGDLIFYSRKYLLKKKWIK